MTGMTENRTELGNARRLARHFGCRIRHVRGWGKWLVYEGGRWRLDDTGEIERLAKATVKLILAEAQASETDAERQELVKWALRSETDAMIRAVVSLARSEPGVCARPEDLDVDPWLFNVANGTLDLRTGQLGQHQADDLLTKRSTVMFDASATCPGWLAFVNRILGGDPALTRFLQVAIGYSLTGQTIEQVLFFLYGSGNNGKSVLLRVLADLLGDYGQVADFDTFLERKSEGPRNDLARLQGARLVAATEAGDGRRLAEGLVKKLTGQDKLAARFLHQEFFEFTPHFKLWFAANHKPVIRGTDHAIWRRIRLIPFTVTIPEDERDPRLTEKLCAELPGIMNWAVEGCLQWQRDGLGPPVAVRAATAEYRAEMDVIGGFLEDRCQEGTSHRAFASALYTAYRQWCERGGERPASQRAFGLALQERGFQRVKSTGGVMAWYGLRLVEDAEDVDRESRFFRYPPAGEKTRKNSPFPPPPPLSEDDEERLAIQAEGAA